MGYCCSKSGSRKINASTIYYSFEVMYHRKTMITIKKRNSRDKIILKEKLELENTFPIFTISERYILPIKVLGSACVLPGQDPRANFNKACRDFCFISSENNVLIGGLFDGHGGEGEKVVSFCISEADYYFSNEFFHYRGEIERFLEDLIQYLEVQLQDNSGIDILNSGASCIVFILADEELYTANLGCNRGVLASDSPPTDIHKRRFSFNNQFQFLSEISNVRRKYLKSSLSAIQLTIDHKPESPPETLRIVSKGGKVKRLTDSYGNFYGPYRVSPNFSNSKGLTVSRCLGDLSMKQIGINSIPNITKSKVTASEKFFIAASDGVWKVMNNKDVVDFIESHRDICVKEITSPCYEDIIRPENSCISQLICEEARLRWLAKVENEDSIIDDISCIIVEFLHTNNAQHTSLKELMRYQSTQDKENENLPEIDEKAFDDMHTVLQENFRR